MTDQALQAISFKSVSKTFGDRQVLHDVSFEIAQGECLCILGRSGQGKSVTLKLLIGLLQPDAGAICIQNKDIVHMSEDGLSQVRRHMGFLFQSAALFDSFSVHDNIAMPLQRLTAKSKQEIDSLVQKTLSDVGLGREQHKMPADLSGGMRKRAGLARALVLEPDILLIDEPSSGLDRVTSSEIDNLLSNVKGNKKTTMVIVTHAIQEARKLGNRLAVLDNGRLIAIGTAQELEKDENELVRALVSRAD